MRARTSLLCLLLLTALLPAGASAAQAGMRCVDVTFPVTLAPGDTTPYSVYGELCARGSIQQKTLQIALHGATYSHLYWDWPFQPERYSYMLRATAAGYAVLNLDRIGIGRSADTPAEAVGSSSRSSITRAISDTWFSMRAGPSPISESP